jgi:hypothetical protein
MRKLVFAAALGLSIAPLAAADKAFHGTIYATGFESPTFTASLPLVGQDNWVGVAGPPGPNLSPNAAIISTDLVFSGQQSVLVAAGYYDAIGSYQRVVNFDVGANRIPIVRVEAAVRLDGPLSPSANNFFAAAVQAIGLCDPILPGCHFPGVGALAISSDGKVYGWSGNNLVPGCPNPPCVPPASFLISAPISLGACERRADILAFLKSVNSGRFALIAPEPRHGYRGAQSPSCCALQLRDFNALRSLTSAALA